MMSFHRGRLSSCVQEKLGQLISYSAQDHGSGLFFLPRQGNSVNGRNVVKEVGLEYLIRVGGKEKMT